MSDFESPIDNLQSIHGRKHKTNSDDVVPFSGSDAKIQHGVSAKTISKDDTEPSSWNLASDDQEDPVARVIMLDVIPAVVIIINGIVVGLSADICPDHTVWVALELFFTTFFTLEVLVKVKVFSLRTFFLGPDWYWSWFDCFCVALAYLELGLNLPTSGLGTLACPEVLPDDSGGSLGFLKTLKLARLGRIVRLLKFKIFIELKMMIQGVFTGLRVLLWAIVLLSLCIYLLGVTCRTLYAEFVEFKDVPSAMFTVFRCFTDGCASYDGRPLQEIIRNRYGGLWMIGYTLVFLFITIGIFNLIMAVFIDNVNDGSVKKKQYNLGISAEKTELELSETVQTMCVKSGVIPEPGEDDSDDEQGTALIRKSTDGMQEYENRTNRIKRRMRRMGCIITKKTFNKWLLQSGELLQCLDDTEIDTSSKFELFDVLDTDLSGKLPFSETIEGLMKCRGPVSKTDIISIRLRVRYLTRLVQQIHTKLGCPPVK
ncbi:CACNA1C [Symbiodinium pilosum]|uniref:CACNA1C protein n=1 Tax=Symbiodinium pilosum TaxID=2952 RepID=A0A812JT68_SYMPI|nr:CACNA1C [Symbiodinium pilosum]